MKKLLAFAIVVLLLMSGCSAKQGGASDINKGTRFGLGVTATINGKERLQSNVTYAAVLLEDGKIAEVLIDTAQNELLINEGKPAAFTASATKKDLKEAYGMKANGSALEWYEQIEELEKWLVGKTSAELDGASKDADLSSNVTVSVDGYVEAVKKAIEFSVKADGAKKIGVRSSASAPENEFQIDTDVAGAAVAEDGKIVMGLFDSAQMKGKLEGGVIVPSEDTRTKQQLKEEYGMKESGSKLEWYEQINKYSKFVAGKTVSELDGAANDADLNSSVSIYLNGFEALLKEAVATAK